MNTTNRAWKVLDKEAGVLTTEYAFSEQGRANGFAARMVDGDLLVISPPKGMGDEAFAELAEFGKVGAVVANNGFHHLGQPEWRSRFPNARYFAAPEAQARIAKKNPKAGAFEPLSALTPLLGDRVGLTASPATKAGETWAWARVADGHAWYGSDVFCNWDQFPGNFVLSALWKLTNSGPGFKLFHLAMMATTKDKKVLLRALLDDIKAHPPTTIVPAHGPLVVRTGLAGETIAMIEAAI